MYTRQSEESKTKQAIFSIIGVINHTRLKQLVRTVLDCPQMKSIKWWLVCWLKLLNVNDTICPSESSNCSIWHHRKQRREARSRNENGLSQWVSALASLKHCHAQVMTWARKIGIPGAGPWQQQFLYSQDDAMCRRLSFQIILKVTIGRTWKGISEIIRQMLVVLSVLN